MKVAYLVLAHGRPLQLARMISRLPESAPIFVHFDKRADRRIYNEAKQAVLEVAPSAEFVRRHRCRWGAPGIMYATLELIHALTNSGAEFDYATLLSGVDYPIKPHSVIKADLAVGGEYIECFPLLEPNRWSDDGANFNARARMHGRYFRFRSRIWRIGSRAMPDGMTAYGGSQWWTLSSRALSYVSQVAKTERRLIRFLSGSFIPDEHFMQTILGNSPLAGTIVQDDLRFAIWDRPEPPFPATLTRADLPLLAASNAHFARKFDFESDRELADDIDARLRASINESPLPNRVNVASPNE